MASRPPRFRRRSRFSTATGPRVCPRICCRRSAIFSAPIPMNASISRAASFSIPIGPAEAGACRRRPITFRRNPMNYGFEIRPAGGLDFVALGALVNRLDPGIIPWRKATHCDIHVSGGEFNVAANLSDCFKLQTGVASAMVDYPLGDLIAERVRAMGVKPFYKHYEHDGVNGPNMATVYSDRGQGQRAPVVFYNRCNEAAAQLKPGDIDWKAIFAGGVRWFHSGGIFAALSPTTAELVIEAMQAARKAGAVTSFDFN